MIDPIDLFDKLDKTNSTITRLRLAQQEVLKKYVEVFQGTPRIGIKLPTGSGKSLIAILILEAWRRAGKVVAILTANKGLAEDMKKRCDELRIPSATIFGAGGDSDSDSDSDYKIDRTRILRKYKLKQLIGIFNYHAYLYGTEYRQEIQPPDVLVVDDASDFETVRNDFFTVRIDRAGQKEAYESIIEKLVSYPQLYPNLKDFKTDGITQSKAELVYFTHTDDVISLLEDYMQNPGKKDNTLRFSYLRNRRALRSFLIFISSYEIELRPLLTPEKSLKMGDIGQIIFMSATLPDEELLHKIFGIGKTEIPVVDEQTLSSKAFEEIETMGKRVIFPLDQTDLGEKVGDKCKDIILTLVKIHKKVLILANSHADTNSIQGFLQSKGIPVLLYKTSEDSEQFARRTQLGVLLCANRYLGLDFPGGTCRIEVVVRLPAIWDSLDAFQSTILNNSAYVEQRIGNRLTQSFGRCNRLEKDQALYFILDSRILARLTGEEQYLRYLPPNMYAELVAGYDLSQGGDIDQAIKYSENSFFGIEDAKLNKILEEEKKEARILKKTSEFKSKYEFEIEGWEKALDGSYESAAQSFDFVADDYSGQNAEDFPSQNLGLLSAFNYYLSAMCYFNAYRHYNNDEDRLRCLESLDKAIKQGGASSWFNNLRFIYNGLVERDSEKIPIESNRIEIRRVKEGIAPRYEDFINTNSSKQKNWKDAFNQMIKDFSKGTHPQMVNALRQCFELLGFEAVIGDNSKQEPDVIATSPSTSWKYRLSIEAKTKEKGEQEQVSSVNQTIGDSGIVERRTKWKTIPVLVTQREDFSEKAVEVARQKATLFTTEVFATLMERILKAIDDWQKLLPSGRTTFIDSIISPYELRKLLEPSAEPVVKSASIEASKDTN